jgi:hypothetical protein
MDLANSQEPKMDRHKTWSNPCDVFPTNLLYLQNMCWSNEVDSVPMADLGFRV